MHASLCSSDLVSSLHLVLPTYALLQVHGAWYNMTLDCSLAGRGVFYLCEKSGSGVEHRSDVEVPTCLPDPFASTTEGRVLEASLFRC